ncbi:hypothetical protein DEU56DRAFT_94241 [Suillus clintonianus]|uniref:uncharacterized protein n=1 Tax=Suillus clintonianus TaxID=1904413 RepID=UPI001B884AB5|nr:uncharacterized protein DEU56DRAFT_94241 [Suillus clintonianus]KAG2121602.1 hypothetical protein DEU56DRAFT_94241 [Suillus clintonianus]
MADSTGATAPQTPARNSALSSNLKSTPHAVGSATVSENISTVGVQVSDVRPWISHDVRNFKECKADEMLQTLLERCTDSSQSLPKKSPTLLEISLKAVLPLCNGDAAPTRKIKKHLSNFCKPNVEKKTYSPFVEAANSALDELENVNVPGIPAFEKNSKTNILFHVNDPSIIEQCHQGKTSTRKPDVVVVSYESASNAIAAGKSTGVRKSACKRPDKRFQWMNIRSTLEFKRPNSKRSLAGPPPAYKMDYVAPAVLYMKYMKKNENDNDNDNDRRGRE